MTKLGDTKQWWMYIYSSTLFLKTIFAFYFYSEGDIALLNPIHLFDTLVALIFPN